jgi:probable rRNA maturation factor
MSRASPFSVQLASRLGPLPAEADFRRWLRAALRLPALVTLRVVNTVEARALNRDYSGRDYATNVLTFAYGGEPLAADIVLCAPVVRAEARAQRKAPLSHYAHLTVHGALHAAGMDHQTARDARAMEAREVEILGTLGFHNPYIEPGATRRSDAAEKRKARRVAGA